MRLRLLKNNTPWRVMAPCNPGGECDVLEFLHSLEAKYRGSRDGLLALLERVTAVGPRDLPVEISHQIGEDLWQFRKGDLRLLWFYDAGKVVVCAYAFIKHGRKTPNAARQRAQQVRAAYLAAKKNGSLEWMEDE